MFKKTKHGQAMVETLVVMGLYFFLIGFAFTLFQSMYNKFVLTVASYEAARTASIYESSEKYSANKHKVYNATQAKTNAYTVIEDGALAKSLLNITDVKIYGDKDFDSIIKDSSRTEFNPAQHLYIKAVIKGKMSYMFPLMSPDLNKLIQEDVEFEEHFIMVKERVWNT